MPDLAEELDHIADHPDMCKSGHVTTKLKLAAGELRYLRSLVRVYESSELIAAEFHGSPTGPKAMHRQF